MEYEEFVCTNNRLERKKRELRETRVGLVEPKVRLSISRSHLSCSSTCQTVDVVQYVGGEISIEFSIGVFERSSPHLFCTCFYSKEETIHTWTLLILNHR
jgi:hypothetical protein